MNSQEEEQVLGIVKNGSFISGVSKSPLLLTTVSMQEARTPESGKIDLKQYENKAIMVSAQSIDNKIAYGASILESAGLILTSIVMKVFNIQDNVADTST